MSAIGTVVRIDNVGKWGKLVIGCPWNDDVAGQGQGQGHLLLNVLNVRSRDLWQISLSHARFQGIFGWGSLLGA